VNQCGDFSVSAWLFEKWIFQNNCNEDAAGGAILVETNSNDSCAIEVGGGLIVTRQERLSFAW